MKFCIKLPVLKKFALWTGQKHFFIYLGRHLWSRGYFGSSVGAVNEDQIKQYIENQSDDPGSFKIWDEPEPADSELGSDISENLDDFES